MSQTAPPQLGTSKRGKSKEEKEEKRRQESALYRRNFAGTKNAATGKFEGGFRRHMDMVIEVSQALDTLGAKLHAGSLAKDLNGVLGGKGVAIGFAASDASALGFPITTLDSSRNAYFTKRDLKHLQSLFRTQLLKGIKKIFQYSIGRAPATPEQVANRNKNARRPVIADQTLREFITAASQRIGVFRPGDTAFSATLSQYLTQFASDGYLSRRAIVKVIRLYTLSVGLYTVSKINKQGQNVTDGARFRPDQLFLQYFRNDLATLGSAKASVSESSFPIILLNKLVSKHVRPLSKDKDERDRLAEPYINNNPAYMQSIDAIEMVAAAWAAIKETRAPKKVATQKQKKQRHIISKRKKATL